METKKYIIKDLYSDNEITYFVSDTTTSLEDIWISGYFKDKKRNKDNDNKPKIFNDLKEAKRYLKEVKIGGDKDKLGRDNYYINTDLYSLLSNVNQIKHA